MNIRDFQKGRQNKITMVTCYDYCSACVLNETTVDALLVGDSVAMVMHGFPTTLYADVQMMELHSKTVVRGAPQKFVVVDMPFLSVRQGLSAAMEAVGLLMRTGVHAVKIEGVDGHADIVRHIVQSGVPVMGHLGLTPQSVHALGGYRVQGKLNATKIIADAKKLEDAGCFSLVLECVPAGLAGEITTSISIPTIGIGAGNVTDGQILVLNDLLGLTGGARPRFLRVFMDGKKLIQDAVANYVRAVQSSEFPNDVESYN